MGEGRRLGARVRTLRAVIMESIKAYQPSK